MEILLSDIFCGIYALLQADDEVKFLEDLVELTWKVFVLHREKKFILFGEHDIQVACEEGGEDLE